MNDLDLARRLQGLGLLEMLNGNPQAAQRELARVMGLTEAEDVRRSVAMARQVAERHAQLEEKHKSAKEAASALVLRLQELLENL